MYYWNKNTQNKTTLEEELFELENVQAINIGTAFFSMDGFRMLKELATKYNLKKDKIMLFLSAEFSQEKPHELLKELLKICTVRIIFDRTFHAKVYWLKGKIRSKLIYGSSNFTNGGFRNNIEFNSIQTLENTELEDIKKFFGFCEYRSTLVDDDVISYYEENSKIIEELKSTQRKIRKKLNGYVHQQDALDEDELSINDYYFTFKDYETFFVHNQARDDSDIVEQRKIVQDKMLAIHKKIYPTIKKMGIECHWRPENITSLIKPCVYNKGKVGWMGVRYGKKKREILELNYNAEDFIGFQKHACLQYSIVQSGFEINLFLAVKHDAVDRKYMHQNIQKLKPKIETEMRRLKGYNMTWEIYNEEIDQYYSFDIDNNDETKFCDYFKKYDDDGHESFLRLFYKADDPRIEDIDSICKEIIKHMDLLLPLYNSMALRL